METDVVAFEVGKSVIEDEFGEYRDPPEDFRRESGLMDQGIAAHTRASIDADETDRMVIYDPDAEPQEIVVEEDLEPEQSGKSLIHELIEWRAVEEMGSVHTLESNTHHVAQFTENSVCRKTNERAGQRVCDSSWNRAYST